MKIFFNALSTTGRISVNILYLLKRICELIKYLTVSTYSLYFCNGSWSDGNTIIGFSPYNLQIEQYDDILAFATCKFKMSWH